MIMLPTRSEAERLLEVAYIITKGRSTLQCGEFMIVYVSC